MIAPGLEARNLERLSATRARITVDRFFDFDISLPEEVSLSIPAAALTSSMAIVATPSFDLLPTSASVSIGGELAEGSTEIAIQAGLEPVLTVQLNSDTLVTTIGREYAADGPSKEFILGLVSEQNEPYGWNNIVQSGLRSSDIQYIDASTVHLKVPQFPSYDIAQPETIVMRIPASAMRNNVEDIPAAAKFVIGASRGIAILKSPPPTANLGSMLGASSGAMKASEVREASLMANATTTLAVDVTLYQDSFSDWAMCEDAIVNVTTIVAEAQPTDWCWPPPPPPPDYRGAPPRVQPCRAQQRAAGTLLNSLPCDASSAPATRRSGSSCRRRRTLRSRCPRRSGSR